jgi:hypothetical protein
MIETPFGRFRTGEGRLYCHPVRSGKEKPVCFSLQMVFLIAAVITDILWFTPQLNRVSTKGSEDF